MNTVNDAIANPKLLTGKKTHLQPPVIITRSGLVGWSGFIRRTTRAGVAVFKWGVSYRPARNF